MTSKSKSSTSKDVLEPFRLDLYSNGSHKKCLATCSLQISEKCPKIVIRTFKDVYLNAKRNNDNYICLFCSRKSKFSGRNNPNTKYHTLKDNFFETVYNLDSAYLLGWIASDGHICESGFRIRINKIDQKCLENIRDIICHEIPISYYKDNMVELSINSKQIAIDLCKHLGLKIGKSNKKADKVQFPDLDSELQVAFLRGYFDGDGCVSLRGKGKQVRCSIASNSKKMLASIKDFVGLNCWLGESAIEWYGDNAIEFLDLIYGNDGPYLDRKYKKYLKALERRCVFTTYPYFKVNRTTDDAVLPSKAYETDSGYDVTIIGVHKQIHPKLTLYKTGIRVAPDEGYYLELVARSSLMKYGCMLANNVGIIDYSYRGEILVAIYNFEETENKLEIPMKVAQLIPHKIIQLKIIQVDSLDDTVRGDGGFGSTGK